MRFLGFFLLHAGAAVGIYACTIDFKVSNTGNVCMKKRENLPLRAKELKTYLIYNDCSSLTNINHCLCVLLFISGLIFFQGNSGMLVKVNSCLKHKKASQCTVGLHEHSALNSKVVWLDKKIYVVSC